LVLGSTIVHDSLLATFDMMNGRIVVFRPDGALDQSIPLRRALTNETGQLMSDTENHLYFKALFVRAPDGRSSQPLPAAEQQLLRMRLDGEFVDSLPMPVFKEKSKTWSPFRPYSNIWPSPIGGAVIGEGDTYEFVIRPFR